MLNFLKTRNIYGNIPRNIYSIKELNKFYNFLKLNNIKRFGRSKKELEFYEPSDEESQDANEIKDDIPFLPRRKFKVLFFGNDEISLHSLFKLYEESFKDDAVVKKLAVVTTPLENKKSFQAIFHKFLNDKKIEKFELNIKTPEDLKNSWHNISKLIQEKDFEIGIVASFGRMIPATVITTLKHGAYVMHPSLLPKYRGAAPIQHAILNKEKVTGVSIVETSVNKFDAGDILLQKEFQIQNFHRFKELSVNLSILGADMTLELLKDLERFQKTKTPQNEALVSKAKIFKDNNCAYLDFVKMTSDEVITIYKAFYGSQLEPFTKGIFEGKERFFFFENLVTVSSNSELYKLIIMKIEKIAKPGDVYWDLKEDRNSIFFKCKEGWLVSKSLKFDGTPYTPGEKVISKIFMNKRFKTKENKELEIRTLNNKLTHEKN
jgi:methionyl-tRNA formyltransferase